MAGRTAPDYLPETNRRPVPPLLRLGQGRSSRTPFTLKPALLAAVAQQTVRPIVAMTPHIEFKAPWAAVTPEERERLEAELSQELCLLHHWPLWIVRWSPVGAILTISLWPLIRICVSVPRFTSRGRVKRK